MYAFPGCFIFAWIGFFFQMMNNHLFVCWQILIDGQSAVKISLFVYFQAMFIMQTLQFLQQPSFACLLLAKSCAFAAGASGHSTRNFILMFWEVVIQHEVVFYSSRMGSFNGGWCRKIKNACILTSHRINFVSNIYLMLHAVCHSHTTKKFATEISKSGTSSSVARTRPGFLICEISKTSRVRSTFCKHVI